MSAFEHFSQLSILITGGCGFIGSHIAEELLKRKVKRVVIADNLLTGSEKNIAHLRHYKNLEVVIGDLGLPDFCLEVTKGIDIILHQAALGSVPRSIQNPLPTHYSNSTAFLNLLQAAKENKISKFVYASSSSVYGDDSSSSKTEAVTGNPLSPYAVTKITNELYANVYHHLHGLQVTGLRYFNVFGERQSPDGPYAAVIPQFIEKMIHGKEIVIYGDGEQKRDFTYVKNVVDANIKTILADPELISGKIFNIAAGSPNSVNTLYKLLAEKFNYRIPAVFVPERKGDIKNSFANINAAERALNFKPLVSFEDGIDRTIAWFISDYRYNSGQNNK